MRGRTPIENLVGGRAHLAVCRTVAIRRYVTEADVRKAVDYVAYAMSVTEVELLERVTALIWCEYRETYASRERQRAWVEARRAEEA